MYILSSAHGRSWSFHSGKLIPQKLVGHRHDLTADTDSERWRWSVHSVSLPRPPIYAIFQLFPYSLSTPPPPHPPRPSPKRQWRDAGRSRIKADGKSRERERDKDKRESDGQTQRRRGVHRQAVTSQVKKRTAHSSRPAELLHRRTYNNCPSNTTVGEELPVVSITL